MIENNNNQDESEKGKQSDMDDSGSQQLTEKYSPTLTHGLVTTVPQNISNSKLGDKHTPTRSSLRHSRMIVMNKAPRGENFTFRSSISNILFNYKLFY